MPNATRVTTMSDAIAVQRDSLTTVNWMAVGGVFAAVCMLATGGIFVKYSTLKPIATGMVD